MKFGQSYCKNKTVQFFLPHSVECTYHYMCLRKKRGVEIFVITSSTVNQF